MMSLLAVRIPKAYWGDRLARVRAMGVNAIQVSICEGFVDIITPYRSFNSLTIVSGADHHPLEFP